MDGKGVRYAVVFLRGADGLKMPDLSEERLQPGDGQRTKTMTSAKCQYEPRVLVLGGQASAFVKSEGPLYQGGPIWRIELAKPAGFP